MKFTALFFILFCQLCGLAQSSIVTNENTLIPEGIAIDPRNGDIYISSIARKKIIKIDSKQQAIDFIREGAEDFLEGLGLKIDIERNVLWALSNKRDGKWFTSQIHGFDLNSGNRKFFHTYKDTLPHLLNDLVIDADRNLIITNTYSSILYKYNPASQKLDPVIQSPKLKYPNGLAFGKNQKLYVATYATGILQIDLNTKDIQPLTGFKDSVIAFGLDGLVYEKGCIYGVFNAGARSTNAIVKYYLDEKKGMILRESILDKANPDFYDPTTAASYKNKLYVIANSHLDQYNKNKETTKGIEDGLLPLKILVYDLKE